MTTFPAEANAAFAANYPEVPHKLTHQLGAHPLLDLEPLAQLAEALSPSSIEYNSGDQPIGVSGKPGATGLSIGETIRRIGDSGSWAVLKNIEQHPAYADLLESLLSELRPTIEARTGQMLKTQGFIFISSPCAVTPFHFDPEHNILLQLRGTKTMTQFPAGNTAYAADSIQEAYHTGGARELTWQESMLDGGTEFALASAFRARRAAGLGLAFDNLAFGMELCRSRCTRVQRRLAPDRPAPAATRSLASAQPCKSLWLAAAAAAGRGLVPVEQVAESAKQRALAPVLPTHAACRCHHAAGKPRKRQ
jgi:hypothetical protein